MQDPAALFQPMKPQFPEQEQLKCPRCDSPNTKFCYYNNYNLSQPRHFCKNCRRYWTKGGALRNIPVGGGTRKNAKRSSTNNNNSKRAASSSSQSPSPSVSSASITPQVSAEEHEPGRIDPTRAYPIGGSFSSLLASAGNLGSLLEGLNSSGSSMKMVQMDEYGSSSGGPMVESDPGRNNTLSGMQSNANAAESFMSMQNGDSSCWNGSSNGWSNLAIYTPGSTFR
ncbi:hypothetical protein RIF29_28054 [Crotalaria pallida]|uniref:Dof zinc finger protein n=1 Tax=Crotalaria pallida TaxID=3830 RepID=A0AAN9EV24_CROPI